MGLMEFSEGDLRQVHIHSGPPSGQDTGKQQVFPNEVDGLRARPEPQSTASDFPSEKWRRAARACNIIQKGVFILFFFSQILSTIKIVKQFN